MICTTKIAKGPPALALRGLSKRFGRVRAVDDVSLSIEAGSVVGIIGENGAGKSTLMSLVYGLHRPDAGAILVEGREAAIAGPQDALRLGIGMVHQHFMLVDTLTVLENVVLGAETGSLVRSLAEGRRELGRLAARFGLAVDPDARVGGLPVGTQQRVEILKALYRRARILILDEPTAVLTPQEADGLFAILRELAAGGVSVVLVTHKLREIMAVTDSVHVLRHGRLVASRDTGATSPAELAGLMMGGALPRSTAAPRMPAGATLLRAAGLAATDPVDGRTVFAGIDLALRAGEIVGVAGVAGNGQGELLECLAGMRPVASGRIVIGATAVTRERPADAAIMRRLGVAHVPEHRHRHGIVAALDAAETSILGWHRRPGLGGVLLDRRAVAENCAALMRRFDVRPPDPSLATAHFSGGNQQKLVLAREVTAGPRILLVGQPTRGVDIAATSFIHAELRRLRHEGCAILLVSSELDEIVALADRILVMSGGRITGEVAPGSRDDEVASLGLLMSGMTQTVAARVAGMPA